MPIPAESNVPGRVIWCNVQLDDEGTRLLHEGASQHRVFVHRPRDGSAPMRDAPDRPPREAEILFGQPEPEFLLERSGVRWLHLSSAGYARYDRADLRAAFADRGVILTNSSHVFDEPCAQHLAAMMLALARRLPQCLDNQRGTRAWLQNDPGGRMSRLINGQTALVYGFGAIARRLVTILRPLEMRVFAVRRAPEGDEGVPTLTEAEADARLGKADHVIDLLPHNATTGGFFDAARLARCKAGARFYNIGRGTTVDGRALADALREGRLDAAYLDVTDPEPLPPGHALWNVPNCFITPHVAGSHAGEEARLVRHFLGNLKRFDAGEPLADRVF